mgnify:CR=1 FL=1
MARKAILETGYTFTPSTNTVVIPRAIQRERLILITNVTTNTVIYNFSDSNLKANTYTVSTTGGTNTTTVVLNYNTSGMSSTDKLQITVDEYDEKFTPSEAFQDPVNKFRTSSPQALIDTDFEYGTQVTKWENLAMINNRPFTFASPIGITTINYITLPNASRTVTVGLSTTAPGVGTAITVQDTYLNIANGNFLVEANSGAGNTIFTYSARATNTGLVTSIFDSNKTGIFSGTTYSSAAIGGVPTLQIRELLLLQPRQFHTVLQLEIRLQLLELHSQMQMDLSLLLVLQVREHLLIMQILHQEELHLVDKFL